MSEKICKYCKDEFCVNDQCPMRADYCPVPDTPGVCKHEERVDIKQKLPVRECMHEALVQCGIVEKQNFRADAYVAIQKILGENGWKIVKYDENNVEPPKISQVEFAPKRYLPGMVVGIKEIANSDDWVFKCKIKDGDIHESIIYTSDDGLLSVSFDDDREIGTVMLNSTANDKAKYCIGQELTIKQVEESADWTLKSFVHNPFNTGCTYINHDKTMIVVFEHGTDHGVIMEFDQFEVGSHVHVGAIGASPKWVYIGEENDKVSYLYEDGKRVATFKNGSDWSVVKLLEDVSTTNAPTAFKEGDEVRLCDVGGHPYWQENKRDDCVIFTSMDGKFVIKFTEEDDTATVMRR